MLAISCESRLGPPPASLWACVGALFARRPAKDGELLKCFTAEGSDP